MANTVVNRVAYANSTQMFLRSALVGANISASKFRSNLNPGAQIVFPYVNTSYVEDYTYSTDATVQPTTMTSNGYSIDQVKVSMTNFDPLQNMLTVDKSWEDGTAQEQGYQLARNMDQYILQTGINNSLNTIAAGALNAGNIFETLTTGMATLGRARAGMGVRYAVVDHFKAKLIADSEKSSGFNTSDAALRNGFVGNSSAGFKIYVSNDLPYSVTLTLAAQPTAGDTTTVAGKTWLWVNDGTAANPGEINVGANLADAQAIFRTAINGTTPPSANDYIDFASDDRNELKNMQLACTAFNANVATITSYGQMYPSETFTSGSNLFGTEQVSCLLGVMNAIDFTAQALPRIEVRDETKNLSHNIIATTQYGAGVFYRDRAKLVTVTANA